MKCYACGRVREPGNDRWVLNMGTNTSICRNCFCMLIYEPNRKRIGICNGCKQERKIYSNIRGLCYKCYYKTMKFPSMTKGFVSRWIKKNYARWYENQRVYKKENIEKIKEYQRIYGIYRRGGLPLFREATKSIRSDPILKKDKVVIRRK